jgi:hypothetical protein
MAYSLETSSVKTIVPGAEVSGFCDVVARQKINEASELSAGEGISISAVDGKTVITNNISAGSNISLVYDMETNTYRIDAQGGDLSNYYQKTETSSKQEISAALDYISSHGADLTNYYQKTETSSKTELSDAFDYISANAGHSYSGIAPIQVDNVNNRISITGESLSAGPGIDMFSSGGYVVVSSTGKELSAGPGIDLFESGGYFVISSNGAGGSTFPITGTNGTTGFTANMDCSSMMLTTGASPAGGYVKQTVRGVQYEAYPATDVSASWYNIINATNNRSNCYCIRFTNDLTAASLENYSAYDKVTVVHSNQYTPNCELYWNGNTKVFPSGLYCELVKGTNDQNETDWFFTTSGWINNVEWDYD